MEKRPDHRNGMPGDRILAGGYERRIFSRMHPLSAMLGLFDHVIQGAHDFLVRQVDSATLWRHEPRITLKAIQ
jgi:hypothetical protein